MKKSIFYLTISIILFCMYSCNSNTATNNNQLDLNRSAYEIIIIDYCEYVVYNSNPTTSEFAFIHKGNCKNH